ncbi:MAG TPA: hypothetical protein VLB90_04025 [Pseudomonadales bacterium]|nr:hypothetical protein [Pseudomonadales bacterium]
MKKVKNSAGLFVTFISLSSVFSAQSSPITNECHLAPLTELTQLPELRSTELTPTKTNYEKYLLRYILLYHHNIIIDLSHHGDGSHLDTLHKIIGIDKKYQESCDKELRDIAIEHTRTADFAATILDYRRNKT